MRIIPHAPLAVSSDTVFRLGPDCGITAPGEAEPYAQTLRDLVHDDLGLTLTDDGAQIVLTLDPASVPDPEGYRLAVSSEQVTLTGHDAAGLFYAMQTLRQIIPLTPETGAWAIPACVLDDRPRFGWRGCLLDCSRHFRSIAFIKRFLDLLARYRMNRFHWHLTDDQGWRIRIDAYPELTEIGAWRDGDDGRYGGFYSKDEIREVVAYAAARHITVIPEIDMPGHTAAVVAALPQLSCRKESIPVPTRFGSNDNVLCAGRDAVFDFAATVLGEVAALFPAPYIHIGGDECIKRFWTECPDCQKRIADEGLGDEKGLEHDFIRRIETIVSDLGKQMIGWDEIFELDSDGIGHEVAVRYPQSSDEDRRQPATVIQSWRHPDGAKAAARCGHPTVVSTERALYLNYNPRMLPLETVYAFDPQFSDLDTQTAGNILGIEAALWGEGFADDATVERHALPRLLAAAECAWCEPSAKDWTAFRQALVRELKRLNALGLSADNECATAALSFDLPETIEGEGELSVHLTNEADEPMSVKATLPSAGCLRFNQNEFHTTVAPASRETFRLGYTCTDWHPLRGAATEWTFSYANPLGPDVTMRRRLVVCPEQTLVICPCTTPRIDGPLHDWPSPDHAIERKDGSPLARFGVGYDETFVYLAATVDCALTLKEDAHPWQQDGIEIRLDGRDEETRFFSDGEVEFRDLLLVALSPGLQPNDPARCFRAEALPTGTAYACKRTGTGFAVQVAVPCTWLFRTHPDWTSVHINITVNEATGDEVHAYHWRPPWRSADNTPWSGTFRRDDSSRHA